MTDAESLYWLQGKNGQGWEIYTASGKRVVPIFTTLAMARQVRALAVERFPIELEIFQSTSVPRHVLETHAMAPGVDASVYQFVYEDSDEFPRLIAGLEAVPPQAS